PVRSVAAVLPLRYLRGAWSFGPVFSSIKPGFLCAETNFHAGAGRRRAGSHFRGRPASGGLFQPRQTAMAGLLFAHRRSRRLQSLGGVHDIFTPARAHAPSGEAAVSETSPTQSVFALEVKPESAAGGISQLPGTVTERASARKPLFYKRDKNFG